MQHLGRDTKTTDELKFIDYIGRVYGQDVYIAKMIEQIDGVPTPKIRIFKDVEVPFWITKPIARTHKQKKEYESMDKLDKYWATQSGLAREIATRVKVGKLPQYAKMRDVRDSPYVYALDIPVTSWIKDWYIRNGAQTAWKICPLDIEVNVKDHFNEYITHIAITMEHASCLTVMRERFNGKGYANDEEIKEDIKRNYIDYVPNGKELWDAKPREIVLCDSPVEMIEHIFKRLHEWKPDFVPIWNLNYDIPKIIEAYEERAGKSMAQLFNDPDVPSQYAYFNFNEGNNKIVTILDNGKEKIKTKKFHEIWHDVTSSASFKFIDAMGLYYQIRSQEPGVEGGYGLENILNTVLSIGKVKDDSKLKKKAWHVDTSDNRPAFYSCYGMFDVDSMLLLDKKTQDLESSGASQLGAAPWGRFSSLPYRCHIAFHFAILKDGYVVGSKASKIEKDSILGIGGGWIVTVPSYRILPNGLKVIEEDENVHTSHFPFVYDLDEVSAYPFATVAANVSKETTNCEIKTIEGHNKDSFLKQNVNIVINKVNAYTYANHMLGLPSFKSLYEMDYNPQN